MTKPLRIPVIDLFAGPGGLGEGFSAFSPDDRSHPFEVSLSIERDPTARETLLLRKFFRSFEEPPPEYWQYLTGENGVSREALFARYPRESREAQNRAWLAELGKVSQDELRRRINLAIGKARHWILVGGPPCQAYSLVGRSRMRSTTPDFEADERHFLYREYLRIVAEHQPPIFLMENVKGLLSATHGGNRLVGRILSDLQRPGVALRRRDRTNLKYNLFSLVEPPEASLFRGELQMPDPASFVVRAECYGIPQARHRIFILGIRADHALYPGLLSPEGRTSVSDVLADLPPLRSTVSRGTDSIESWKQAIAEIQKQRWMGRQSNADLLRTARLIRRNLSEMAGLQTTSGAPWLKTRRNPRRLASWYRDTSGGISCHQSRGHMASDLRRYFFAATFAQTNGQRSPTLGDFPSELLPEHQNAMRARKGELFSDRFRVQLPQHPSTTVTSHISKDGHYFIHYDPLQCRSLTVREAARLQTFPDSYFFEGPRTEQYRQVGNAVPPLLASKIAEVVHDLVTKIRVSSR